MNSIEGFISGFRRGLYRSASVMGDVQAAASGSPTKVVKRVVRKTVWRLFARSMRKLMP